MPPSKPATKPTPKPTPKPTGKVATKPGAKHVRTLEQAADKAVATGKVPSATTIPTTLAPREEAPKRAVPLPLHEEREVLYNMIELVPHWVGKLGIVTKDKGKEKVIFVEGVGEMTEKMAKKILGWEDEEEYAAKMMAKNPERQKAWEEAKKNKASATKLGELAPYAREELQFGSNFVLKVEKEVEEEEEVKTKTKNAEGVEETKTTIRVVKKMKDIKVQCWNNTGNREFDLRWCQKAAQSILNRQWKMNGESWIIGKTGSNISLQHRALALIIACYLWRGENIAGSKQAKMGAGYWKQIWPEQPTIPALVVRGVEEDEETLATVDNVRPRNEADQVFTSGMFNTDAEGNPMSKADKGHCSKMIAKATDFVWDRTRAGTGNDWVNKFRTNLSAMDFRSRHARLLDCTRHIFNADLNKGISAFMPSVGTAVGIMYLMASANSDVDDYLNPENKRSEEVMDFSMWELAKKFWDNLAKGEGNTLYKVVRYARRPLEGELLSQYEEEGTHLGYVFRKKVKATTENPYPVQPVGGSPEEQIAVLARAWHAFVDNDGDVSKLDFSDCELVYDCDWQNNEDGTITLSSFGFDPTHNEIITFGGIDLGSPEQRNKPGAKGGTNEDDDGEEAEEGEGDEADANEDNEEVQEEGEGSEGAGAGEYQEEAIAAAEEIQATKDAAAARIKAELAKQPGNGNPGSKKPAARPIRRK